MTSSPAAATAPTRSAPTARSVALAALVAAVAAAVGASLVVLVAVAVGAPEDARQLQPATFLPFAVVGAVVGAIGWSIVVRRSTAPRRLLPRLVVAVMAVLFVPDVLIAVSGAATWGTAVALMVAHVVVAAVVIPVYARLMPPRD